VPVFDDATIAAVIAAGHAAGVRSIVHVGSSDEALQAVRAGADALAHSPWRDEISDETVAAIAAAQVPVVPTLAVFDVSSILRTRESDFLPIEHQVAQAGIIAKLIAPPPKLDEGFAAYMRVAAAAHDARRRNVAKMRAAGVTILVGSDACNPGQFPGAGMHVELAKLVDAGMTAGEALRAATFENARFLAGEDADFGEIAVGKRGDLVMVGGDPTSDIAKLGGIERVVVDGVVLERRGRE
jgi:imidazolonepropionase-like amidohydrolase